MFGQRSPKEYENYVDRLLNAEDVRLKQNTSKRFVLSELDEELNKVESFYKTKLVKDRVERAKNSAKATSQEPVVK